MAVEWAAKSDCTKVFPKLPFHLSMYHTKLLRNQRTKAAVAAAAPHKKKLGVLNDKSGPQSSPDRTFGIRGSAAVAGS